MSESEEIGASYRKVIEVLERKIARIEGDLNTLENEIQKSLETSVRAIIGTKSEDK